MTDEELQKLSGDDVVVAPITTKSRPADVRKHNNKKAVAPVSRRQAQQEQQDGVVESSSSRRSFYRSRRFSGQPSEDEATCFTSY
jgi:hypothetical protein